MIRVSVIGAGRRRNGIGEYIAKYFHKNGAQVVSVLGTTRETSERASVGLRKYGVEARPYIDVLTMVKETNPEVLAIASPAETHDEYLRAGVELGMNLFCEKPFVWGPDHGTEKVVREILERAKAKQLKVTMNSQWPFSLTDYEALCGRIEFKIKNTFFVLLSPTLQGKEMIPDSVPHALSLLHAVFGEGKIPGVDAQWVHPGEVVLRFDYVSQAQRCEAVIKLIHRKEQPRDFQFGFNGKIVQRDLDLRDYGITFYHGDSRLRIADPLERSVVDFLRAVEKNAEPLVGHNHILRTTCLLREIYDQL